MLRKTILALLAVVSVGALSVNAASARDGGGGGRSFSAGGGGMSAGHGSFGGGGMAMGGRGASSFASTGGMNGGGVRSAAIGNNFARNGSNNFVRNGSMPSHNWSNNWSGGHHHHGNRGFIGLGFYGGIVPGVNYCDGYYDNCYPGYAYYNGDTYDDGCYLARRRVHTPYGWRVRSVQVCS